MSREETFELEWVNCGKVGCRSCPHGPYWYAYRKKGKKLARRYIGKQLPKDLEERIKQTRRWLRVNALRWIEDGELPPLPKRQL